MSIARRLSLVAIAAAFGLTPAAQAAYPGRPGLIAYVLQYDDCVNYRFAAAAVHAADCGGAGPPEV